MLGIRRVLGNFPFPQQTLTSPRVEKFTNLSNMLRIIRKLVVGSRECPGDCRHLAEVPWYSAEVANFSNNGKL